MRSRWRWRAVVSCGMLVGVLAGCRGVQTPAAPGSDRDPNPRSAPASTPPDPALAPFAPMAGVWRADVGGTVFEETWLAPAGRNMTGALRAVGHAGRADLFELMTLTPESGGVRLRLRHFDADLTPWASEADGPVEALASGVSDGVAVFATGADADDPRAVTALVYDWSEPGRLTATVRFGGGRSDLVIDFVRVRGGGGQAAMP